MAVSPDGASVYSSSQNDAAVVSFSRAPDGKLSPLGCVEDDVLTAVGACANIHLDTSSSNGWVRYTPGLTLESVFRTALSVVGLGELDGLAHDPHQPKDLATREARNAGRPLDAELLKQAFRGSDFVLNHLAVGEDLAAGFLAKPAGEWNTMRIETRRGGKGTFRVNGQ